MPIAPEQEHPTLEKRIEEPGELARLDKDRQELKGYLTAVEEEKVKEPVTDDATGQVLLTPSQTGQAGVTAQLTQDQIKEGRRHPITDAFHWFVEWFVRMHKKIWIQSQP